MDPTSISRFSYNYQQDNNIIFLFPLLVSKVSKTLLEPEQRVSSPEQAEHGRSGRSSLRSKPPDLYEELKDNRVAQFWTI